MFSLNREVLYWLSFGKSKACLTMRAADKWDSARFSSLSLALSFFRLISRIVSRPLAANASR